MYTNNILTRTCNYARTILIYNVSLLMNNSLIAPCGTCDPCLGTMDLTIASWHVCDVFVLICRQFLEVQFMLFDKFRLNSYFVNNVFHALHVDLRKIKYTWYCF